MTETGLLLVAVRALSVFNTMALLWLGSTILLTTERRRWGAWVSGSGLVVAGLLLALHAVMVETDLRNGPPAAGWWLLAWLTLLGAPYLWCVVMAWYTGRAGQPAARLALGGLAGAGVLAITLVAPRADYEAGATAAVDQTAMGLAVAVAVACIALALGMLQRPGTSDRFMGDLARRRARPWLVATSLVLLLLALLAGLTAAWLVSAGWPGALTPLLALDLALQALVATTVVLLGRAVVAYEVFTGKPLPRRGLHRHWQTSLLVAAAAGVLVGVSASLPVTPVARLMLLVGLAALVLALLNWRAYVEHEHALARLRPFVASQRLVEQALRPADVLPPAGHGRQAGADALRALREDVLGARWVALAPRGPLAAMVGAPLVDPPAAGLDLAAVDAVSAAIGGPGLLSLPLAPGQCEPARWVTPLWGESGLIGLLLLGPKRGDGLYAQEEIEVARATGERILDSQAGIELTRRLVSLQRQRLAESQVIDHRSRQVLHDDVLPRIHAALLALPAPATADQREVAVVLGEVHRAIANLLRSLPPVAGPDLTRVGLPAALRQVVDQELGDRFAASTWQVDEAAVTALRALPPATTQVVFGAAREAIRNAARHAGGASGRLPKISVSVTGADPVVIIIDDDGVGLSAAIVQAASAGHGLALHETLTVVVGGTLTVGQSPAGGVRVTVTAPRA